MKDWKKFSLEIEEEDMLESLENGEWKSNENLTSRKEELKSFFQNNLDQETINTPLSNEALELIKSRINELGISEQSFIGKILHEYAVQYKAKK